MPKKAKLNEEVIEAICAYTPEQYLDDEQTIVYRQMKDIRADITSEREQAVKGLDPASIEYIKRVNGVRQREFSGVIRNITSLEGAALVRFTDTYYSYVPELRAAGYTLAERAIASQGGYLKTVMQGYGLTLDDARRIDAENIKAGYSDAEPLMAGIKHNEARLPNTPEAWDVLRLFSRGALEREIAPRIEHVFVALDRAYTLENDADISATDYVKQVCKDVIPRKWEIAALEMPSTSGIRNKRGDITLPTAAGLAAMSALTAKTAEHNPVRRERVQRLESLAGVEVVRVIVEEDAPPLNTTAYKILQFVIAVFYRNNPGTKKERISRVIDVAADVKLSEVCELFTQWSSTRTAQKQLREAWLILTHMKVETRDIYTTKKGKRKMYSNCPRIVSSVKTHKGGYTVYLDGQFAEYLAGSYVVDVPALYFSAGANASAIIYKLANHAQMNRGKRNAGLIHVGTLLDACPEMRTALTIRWKVRIVEQLEAAMEECEPVFSTIEFCERGGRALTRPSILDYTRDEIINDIEIKFEFRKSEMFSVMGSSVQEGEVMLNNELKTAKSHPIIRKKSPHNTQEKIFRPLKPAWLRHLKIMGSPNIN